MAPVERRDFLAASAAALGTCWAGGTSADAPGARAPGLREVWIRVEGGLPFGEDCLVLVPEHLEDVSGQPLLVLLHGFGATTVRSRSRAERSRWVADTWRREYAVVRAHERLNAPPIAPIYDTVRYLGSERAASINASLATEPFRGLVLACPRVPVPYYRHAAGPVFPGYAQWIEDTLLPAVRRHAPVSQDPARTGLAGHSMGAHVGLEVLLRKPHLFGAFSGVQMAVSERAAGSYARRVHEALERSGPRRLQVVTSTRDPYRAANHRFAEELERLGVQVDLRESFGAHTGSWMREIGSLETLLFQDRALRSP